MLSSPPTVLLVSAGLVHPPLLARIRLRRLLARVPGYRLEQIGSLEQLPDELEERVCALVLYYHHQRPLSQAALARFERFVDGGGGVLAIHSATASFKESPGYFDILGGRFGGHGPVQPIEVRPADTIADPFAGSGAFAVVDELYRHEQRPGNRVHFYGYAAEERQPVLWTRHYGQGRIVTCALGHRAAVFRQPQLQALLQRGLAWVCG